MNVVPGFLAFLSVLGVVLTPAQAVLWTVLADGVQPGSLVGPARDLARQLFGDVDFIPPALLRQVAIMKGARMGGTWSTALRLVHLALTVSIDRLAHGESAFAIIVGPDLRLALQALGFARGAMLADAGLARLVSNVTATSFTIDRGRGRSVIVECLPATRGGSALRGRALVGVQLTEGAFFRAADNGVVNDADIYAAVLPRVLPGGQIIIESTPWCELGLLWELYEENMGSPRSAVVAHAPTLLMRDDDKTRSEVAIERRRDPDNAAREFDAIPVSGGAGAFFEGRSITGARSVEVAAIFPEPFGESEHPVGFGLDAGLRSDSTALVGVRQVGRIFDVFMVKEWRPQRGAPLVPSVVFGEVGRQIVANGGDQVVADGHYIESVREHLRESHVRLVEAPAGQDGKADTYVLARQLLNDGRVHLPDNPRLEAQLRNIISKPLPGGGLQVSSPRRAGQGSAHGDLVSALVLALWRVGRTRPVTRGLGRRSIGIR